MSEMELRERRAQRYSARCRRRKDVRALRVLCASAAVFLLAVAVALGLRLVTVL